jgi:hypothetical protein
LLKRKIALGECNRKPGYQTSEEQFPFHFQKPEIFDKVEAVNIVGLLSFEYRTAEALPKEYKMK